MKTYEESMGKLEEIVRKLEDGGLSLEESIELFQQGVKLSSDCSKMLDDAKLELNVLGEDGEERPAQALLDNLDELDAQEDDDEL